MPRKPNNKTLKRQCDTLWSKIIRSYGHCEKCGKTSNLEAAHIVSRRYIATRHLLDNGLCLCTGCHFWGHHNPTKFTWWLEEYLGRDVLEDLHKKAEPTYGKTDWKERRDELKEILERL